ncbi:MAG: DUF1849 family protein [Rhodospirillales bacterium]|nr:DUF1849 family protein [Rhodospirillales bacterium]
MRALSFILVLLLFALPAHAAEIQDKASAFGFQPHKALYDIKLSGVRSGSQVLNISGQMFYEWQPSCDAWITNHRFNILYEYADSAPMRITSNFSTYEPFDGKSMNFTSQRKRDGDVFEEIRGGANVAEDGSAKAVFTVPSDLEFDLPAGTLFPLAHSMEVVKKIREGQKFHSATIFDGSDEDGPVSVTAFIGKPAFPVQEKIDNPAIDQTLLASPAHDVRLAFFPLLEQEETSDYEMNLVMHENSLISDMVIEYDDFTVAQNLVAVEPIADGCQRSKFNQ